MTAAFAQIALRSVAKSYGPVTALAPVDLDIADGEFFSLLGPSGCGKSTLLKIVAGFELPSSGKVFVAGKDMSGVPPERRSIGFVFQNYALFPHMTVAENVAFGLRARGAERRRIASRVNEVLSLVELDDYGMRRPNELSGGQQQRVALARALAIEPSVLLLDEPFGALDRNLRQSLQRRLVELQRKIRVTTVFVTHDQEEALTMSDRVAVMSVQDHRFEQVGTPREIYEQPKTAQVAGFVGQSNWLIDRVAEVVGPGLLRSDKGFRMHAVQEVAVGQEVLISLRPERISFSTVRPEAGENTVAGEVRDLIFLGDSIIYVVEAGFERPIQVKALNNGSAAAAARGDSVWIGWAADAMQALPKHESPTDATTAGD